MAAVYTATAVATGEGRAGGRAQSDDGQLDVTLAVPTGLGGPGGGTNPEQLFAAGWASCFHSALKSVAAREKVTLRDSAVVAHVGLLALETGYTIEAALDVEIGGLPQAEAERLVHLAHQVCPYSNATRGNVEVRLTTTTDDADR
ncbi:Ohr family peroxiredoxin [Cellulomonas fimi]|uniref:Peroxiredoxin, Ohr subfamily n=1 Tax=Cellulomonas fimi (strain ATCC 484 / DSM 20113 / JCM 1341 / CCUG 24087 / LMG 16345 / NBRC 15513 / NCIMB 8980 / NCTC 7547 / NRS-133) TaxID=590998 RepID=F4H7J5_CELFA|nr:Ohr family peroxiredoxin [Cellulomonas fimi]AEE44552.1 peroxiredoxin, Ohr subfamily [Cellulomonas fimi ATCC 484]NNH06472.1 Ohr family peroxiredoxin [Cellulomonas fimi]VEH26600.1 General stress protein 17o [Cellulomonas fimi]